MGLLSSRLFVTDPDEARRMEEEQRLEALTRRGLLSPDIIKAAGDLGVPTSGMARITPSFDNPSLPIQPTPSPAQASLPARPEPRGGFRGLLDSAYAAVDPILPGDGLLDPAFNGGSRGGGLLSGLTGRGEDGKHGFNLLRAADSVLGVGVFPAIDRERGRVGGRNLQEEITKIGQDSTLDPAGKISRMRNAINRAAADGMDVTGWLQGLEEVQQRFDAEQYRAGLPADQRLEAKLDLPGFITEHRLRTRPEVFSSTGPIRRYDPTKPEGSQISDLSPGVPDTVDLTTDRVTADALRRWQRGEDLSVSDQAIVDRYLHGTDTEGSPMTMDRLTAEAFMADKPTPLQIKLREEYFSRGGSMDFLTALLTGDLSGFGGGGGGGDHGGGTRQSPARPNTQKDFDALPAGAWFINPADGRLLQKE